MKYKFKCVDDFCGKVQEIEISENVESFTCKECCSTNDVYCGGVRKEFQRNLDAGIPKDKHGSPIQAGDIIKSERSGGIGFGVVEWLYDVGYRIRMKTRHDLGKPLEIREYNCLAMIESDYEIIGSIYDNIKLLQLNKIP